MKDQHREKGITRDGYKKHCYALHKYKINLDRLIVTETTEEGEENVPDLKCPTCGLILSRVQTYKKHVEGCKGWPQNRYFIDVIISFLIIRSGSDD